MGGRDARRRAIWRVAARVIGVGAVALLLGWDPGRGHAVPEPTGIRVPPGFRIAVYASGLGGSGTRALGPVGAPRMMALDPGGALLVSLPGEGRIVALPDRDGDGRADGVATVARDLDLPHGLAFRQGQLYVAETGRILRFQYDAAALTARDPVVVVPDLPPGAHHWTRTIAFGPDGGLYVTVGSSCDVCRERDRRRATIVRYEADGSGERLFATGLRSVVGIAFHPVTGALWATVNERDWKSGGAPPDYVTEVRVGASYGWPDCYASSGRFAPDPEFRSADHWISRGGGPAARGEPVNGSGRCEGLMLPTLELAPHSAPLGLTFYAGQQFPETYRGSLFVAYHGSRPNVTPVAGYKVVHITRRGDTPARVQDFATDWYRAGRVHGRPVDLLVGRDGALYISDDHAGVIHRVTFGR